MHSAGIHAAANQFAKANFLIHLEEGNTIYYNRSNPPAFEVMNILRKGKKLSMTPRAFPHFIAYVVANDKAVLRLAAGKD